MNTIDLKINNWVYFKDGEHLISCWVSNINLWSLSGYLHNDALEGCQGEIDQFAPMPLSYALLKRAGFKNFINDNEMFYYKSFSFKYENDGLELLNGNMSKLSNTKRYKYIHEIQNLIYTLTGVELSIKSPQPA